MTGKRIINAKTAFAVCFLALMAALGASSVFVCLKKHLVAESPKTVICADVPAVESFKEIYPFDETSDQETLETSAALKRPKLLSAYLSAVSHLQSSVNRYLTYWNLLSRPIYRLSLTLDEIIGNNVIENDALPIIRLPGGYFTYTSLFNDSSEKWESIKDWSTWLKERNIPLFQLLPATKADDSMAEFPPVILHEYVQMIEQYKAFLDENQIPYLDAKNVLLARNDDFYSWFYKADHHWNVLAGRTIAEAVAQKLNDEFDIKMDADEVKEENFTLTLYPSIFRGSMAIKAGTKPEDIEVFYHRKESCFHLKIPSIGLDRTGRFSDTLIAQQYLKDNTYTVFLYGDKPLIQIENQTCTNGTKILVIKHSQANVVCPYLACAVQYMDIIDPRFFDGNIKAFIEQTKPNIVLICI